MDSLPDSVQVSKEDQRCEDHYRRNYFREKSGRFVVRLPFKDSPSILGDTRELAMQRFLSLERRFTSQVIMYESYREFMREYLELGHMELVSEVDKCPANAYYLPHHPVIKESSTTTKLRVAFDVFAKSTTDVSLNDMTYLWLGREYNRNFFLFF